MSRRERHVSVWQAEGGLTAAVLAEVFSWLGGTELARAGAVCRAWRAAAADPALWRRLLLPLVTQPLWEHKQALATLYGIFSAQPLILFFFLCNVFIYLLSKSFYIFAM